MPMVSGRGVYGAPLLGASFPEGQGARYADARGTSLGAWLVGGLLVGGAVLWAKHQSSQIEKLYATAGLPHQSFVESLRARSREISSTAREKIHRLTAPRKEIQT